MPKVYTIFFSAVNVTGCRQAMYNNKSKNKRPRLKKRPGDEKRRKKRLIIYKALAEKKQIPRQLFFIQIRDLDKLY